MVCRPTCHYADRPADDTVLSLEEFVGNAFRCQPTLRLMNDEIIEGHDQLGVLLYGHARNAYWYGSQLSITEARRLAPYQNATTLQVTSAVLGGMVRAIENPRVGMVDADELGWRRVLEIPRPYFGPIIGTYTGWTPLSGRPGLFPQGIDADDPWKFRNVLVR